MSTKKDLIKKDNNKNNVNNNSVYFFADHKLISNKNNNCNQKLKAKKAKKCTTVFMLNKDKGLAVSDEEIAINYDNLAIETEALKQANKAVEKQNKKPTKWLNVSFFILNILVVVGILIYQINKMGVATIEKLTTFRWIFIVYALLIFALIMLLESFRTFILIFKVTKTVRPILSYKSAVINRFYDCITPFATGGQPFEVFYLNSRGLKGGPATSVPLAKSVFQVIAFIIVSIIVLIFGSNLFGENQIAVTTWGIISLVIAIFLVGTVLMFSISKKIMPKITMFFIKLLHKLKLVKDYNLTFNKCMKVILEYQKSMKFYAKSVLTVIVSFVSSGLIVVLKAIIPLMIYCVFNASASIDVVMEVFSKFIIIELATKYIPLPGGTGVAEISFSALFASLFGDGTLFWALLLYRIFNYFIYLFQGLVVIIYDFAYGNRKNRRLVNEKMLLEKNIIEKEEL